MKLNCIGINLLRSRIALDDQWLRLALSTDGQSHLVLSRECEFSAASASTTAASPGLGRCRTEIPNPAMKPGRRRQRLLRARTKRWVVQLVRIDGRKLVFA